MIYSSSMILPMYLFVFGSIAFFYLFFSYKKITPPVWVILSIAFVLRFFIIFIFSETLSSDIYSFLTTGHVLLQSIPTYPAMYFPFIFYLGGLSLLIGKYIAPLIFLKIIFCVCDVGVTYLIYRLSDRYSAFLYAINPPMLLIVPYHGQMDPLPLLFLLSSILLMHSRKYFHSSILLGIAIATKPWPLIFSPVFIKRIKNPFFFSFIFMIPFITAVIHSSITHIPLMEILTPIKNYRGSYGLWGIGSIMYSLFPLFWDNAIQVFRKFFLVSFAVVSFIDQKKIFLKEFILSLLIFFVFSPLFGAQWLSWLLPFVIIEQQGKSWPFILITTIYLGIAFLSDLTVEPLWYGPVRDAVLSSIGLILWFLVCRMLIGYKRLRNLDV